MTPPDADSLFQGTAWHYARFRPGYPPALLDHLVAAYQLEPGARIADLGCGTGQLAIPLAQRGMAVLAIDPSPEMLEEGAAQAARAGVTERIQWLRGPAEELPALVRSPLRLVTCGAAFHWMDRDRVLEHCDRRVESGGGVALVSGGATVWAEDAPPWARVIREVLQETLGPQRRAGAGVYATPPERHETVLARSAFRHVESWSTPVTIERDLDQLIGLQYSTSYASPALLGDRRAGFEATLRARLLALYPEGRFVEHSTVQALCAHREKPGS